MSSYVMAKVDESGIRPVEELENMYQVCYLPCPIFFIMWII